MASAINISGLTPEEAEANAFWARLTAKPATTTNGSGKVFVVSAENYSSDPTDGDYVAQSYDEGWSDIFLASSLINADAQFRTFAKADNGSYFTGWSFTDGYTDLGTESSNFFVQVTPSATKGHANYRNYDLFAAFKAVQLVSYEMVSGSSQEVADDGAGNWKCTQTIKFRAETPGFWALSSVGDERHFKRPVITRKAGTTGTWAIDDAAWISSGVGQNVTFHGDYAELSVPVTFTAPNGDPGEYGATLTLETYAGVKMTVYLYARKTAAGAQAIRYNKSKVQQEAGALATLLTNAADDDIIKLNGNYSGAVGIDKNITFDLNGYTLSNTLTVSGGNVTLAYSPFGGTISNNVSVTGGKLTLVGGTITGNVNVSAGATLEQNGAAITGSVTNAGTMTTTDGSITGQLASSGTLTLNGGTFTNNSDVAVNITGGTADIKRGTISGSTYGVQTTAGETTIGKLAAVTGSTKALYGNGGTLTVNNGKFTDPANLIAGTVTFNAGYFQTNNAGGSTALGKQVWRNTAGVEAREGYEFFVGDQAAAQASNVSVCRIGHTSYSSLEDALAYANNNPTEGVIIIMENDYSLPAGYYTIPAKATLIVPMSNDQETANPIVPRSTDNIAAPVSFRKLIFESGVNMEVAGTIELTCTQYGKGETMGVPGGNFGHLILKPGSHMTINNGGYLRAWGFVTGDGTKDGAGNYLSGEIDARRGGTVHEMFQMGDWKGGDLSFTIAMEIPGMDPCWRDMAHLFPIYMYFIQNVESPVKYHPGSSLICATSVNVASSINAYANDIKVVGKVGEPAMFLMDEMADADNTWVRKYYDAKKDQQVYEVNSGAQLGSMVINLGEVPAAMISPGTPGTLNLVLDSRKFVLPLTSNFKIHLLSGHMEFTQSTSCLPGMEVEIDKESEVAIVKNSDNTVVSGALYFYDADQWSFQNNQALGYVGNSGKFGAKVRYSATWDLGTNGATKQPNVRDISSPAAIGDAILNVHGTFRMGENCSVYTTWSKDMSTFQLDESGSATGGASVISTNEDAGTFIYGADAPAFDGLHFDGEYNIVGFGPNVIVNYDHNNYGLGSQYPVQITTVMNTSTPQPVFGFELCSSVKLKNGDGTFVSTDGTLAGTSYCYRNGQWTTMQVAEDECFMKEVIGGQTTYYAKPAEYVAVNATWDGEKMVGNEDHTFCDKAGAGRLFILMDDCQWWEVEKKDNFYHCIHPNNDTYYYWKEEEEVKPDLEDPDTWYTIPAHWEEKKFTITWLNWDGTIIQTTNEDGDLVDNYDVTYGTMAEFFGSNPTREANIDYTYDFTGWQPELGPVTSNVTYTATYAEQPRKYTIIFQSEGGVEIERQFLTHNEMPACENTPTRVGHTLEWSPAIKAVTGDATYTATWLEEPPTEYEITFYDYNGTTELQKGNVNVGVMPTPPADPSNKPATTEFTYVFDHWSPALEEVSVTSAKSYTAVYREVAKTYTVIFQDENGDEIERHDYPYGATPVCSATPTKENTAQYTYSFAWTPQIQTVMGAATYQAVFTPTTNKYTVTLRSNNDAVCTFTGAGIYDYNTPITISISLNDDGDVPYEFLGWTELGEDLRVSIDTIVTGDISLTAKVVREDIASLPDMQININQAPIVPPMGTFNIRSLILTSDGEESAQLLGNIENLKIWGDAFFFLDMEIDANTWYAVAVPWQVEVNGGIYKVLADAEERLRLGSNFYLISYDGGKRAVLGNVGECWTFATNSDVMQPGRLYMIYVTEDIDGLMFKKKDRAPLQTKQLTVQPYPQTTGHTYDAGWNGIANPALFHAYLNANADTYGGGANFYQRYIPDETRYEALNMEDDPLIVGAPIFVQVAANKTVVAYEDWGDAALHAPARKLIVDDSYYKIRIAADDNYTDQLYVQTKEGKEDEYVIGLDLAKAGISSTVAQMWVERYDTKLCVNTTAPVGSSATYPLGIFAPQDGDYQIYSATDMQAGQELYVTRNGRTIWNLAYGPYTATLNAGTNNEYGLKLIQAPAVTTGVDPVTNDQLPMTNKVIIDNHVYIIRDGAVYTITGQKVQ